MQSGRAHRSLRPHSTAPIVPFGTLDSFQQAKESPFWACRDQNHALRKKNLAAVKRKDSRWEELEAGRPGQRRSQGLDFICWWQ